jgi:hypothetical protein
MAKETVLESIIAHIIGHKYYANIINTRGTDRIEMSSFIHRSREEAEAHRKQIEETRTYLYLETISFRSRKRY